MTQNYEVEGQKFNQMVLSLFCFLLLCNLWYITNSSDSAFPHMKQRQYVKHKALIVGKQLAQNKCYLLLQRKKAFWVGIERSRRQRLGRMESRFSWDCQVNHRITNLVLLSQDRAHWGRNLGSSFLNDDDFLSSPRISGWKLRRTDGCYFYCPLFINHENQIENCQSLLKIKTHSERVLSLTWKGRTVMLLLRF